MASSRTMVFYEDSLAPGANSYPPHEFVLACVGDRVGKKIYELGKTFLANPCNSNTKIKASIEAYSARSSTNICALIDQDRVDDLLSSQKPVLAPAVKRRPRKGVVDLTRMRKEALVNAGPIDRVRKLFGDGKSIFLLDPNLEGIVQVAMKPCAAPIEEGLAKLVLEKRSLDDRDIFFRKLAFGDRAVRDCILKNVSGLAELVEHLVTLCA